MPAPSAAARARARRSSRRRRSRRRSASSACPAPSVSAPSAGSRAAERAVSPGAQRGREVRRRQDREHQPGLERVEPAALLQVQREHEEERRQAGPEHELGHQPGAERALAEQRRVEQRRAAARLQAALVRRRTAPSVTGRGAEAQPRPRRPAVLAALDERQHERRPAPSVISAVPTRSRRRAALDARLGDEAAASAAARRCRSGTLMRKHAAPAEAGDVGLTSTPPISCPPTAARPSTTP